MGKSGLLIRQFQKLLLAWFDQHGRKGLPWQQNKSPYRVWVSEIMLQQTQVKTVLSYFDRFMQHFPSVQQLAQAHEDEVLLLWAGLGYYSRARNLHRAAQVIAYKWDGIFPNNLADLQALPGIGKSTAAAILSLAFEQPAAILDGNVKRVLARVYGVNGPVNARQGETLLWQLAGQLMPKQRCADYTQAMMDLGAIVCTPKKPDCTKCPVKKICVANQQGTVALLPIKKPSRVLPTREATFLVLKKGKEVIVCKRPSTGIWGGLWSLPEIAGSPGLYAIQTFCRRQFGMRISDYQALPAFRHTFSHYHLLISPVIIEIKKKPLRVQEENVQHVWYNLGQKITIGLPKPIKQILASLSKD